MSRIVKTFKNSFKKMIERHWDTIYVFVDMHETCVAPTWKIEISTDLYPKCLETLQLMSQHPNIKLILWSSSLPAVNLAYQNFFKEKGVNFDAINSNPFEKSPDYADFDSKPYMSIILDDKASFQPSDWEALYDYMVLLKSLELLQQTLIDTVSKNQILNLTDNLQINLNYGF